MTPDTTITGDEKPVLEEWQQKKTLEGMGPKTRGRISQPFVHLKGERGKLRYVHYRHSDRMHNHPNSGVIRG
jgi:hypothetical protein